MQEAKSKIMIKPLRKYLNDILEIDKKYAPFSIVGLEKKYSIEYDVNGQKVLLRGIIDRIDLKEKEGILRIVDYKTSKIDDSKKTYSDNFWDTSKFSSKEAVQILMYSEIIANIELNYKYDIILPYFYSIKNINDGFVKCHTLNTETNKKKQSSSNVENFLSQHALIDGKDVSLRIHFNDKLKEILSDLLDKDKHFTQTENSDACKICSYNKICNK